MKQLKLDNDKLKKELQKMNRIRDQQQAKVKEAEGKTQSEKQNTLLMKAKLDGQIQKAKNDNKILQKSLE